jgi:hypothetical protein
MLFREIIAVYCDNHVEHINTLCEHVAAAGSSLADSSTLKMEAIRSSETSVHTKLHGATSQKTAFFGNYCVHKSPPLALVLSHM